MRQFITALKPGGLIDEEWLNAVAKEPARSVLFHFYSGDSDKNALSFAMHTLRQRFPSSAVVGTESGGEIKEGSLMERGTIISAITLEKTDIRVTIYDQLSGNERAIGAKLRRQLDEEMNDSLKAAELLLPGALLNTLELYEELRLCDPSIYIFGGYAGNHDADLENAFVMSDGIFYDGALIVITYCGEDFHIDIAKSAGWQRLGMPFKITRAEGNLLKEINNIPAAEVYKRYLNIDIDEDFVDNTNEFPIAAYVGGEEILRHTNSVNEDGSLLLAGSVLEGWDMYLSFGNPSGIIEMVNERLGEVFRFDPQAILLYSCFVRKLFWERFVNVELEPFQKIAPTAGFNTFGEVLRNMKTGDIVEYNITLLSIAMREGPAKRRSGEVPQADDASLSGLSSLIMRLAKLVSSSTNEIRIAYSNLEKLNEQLKYTSEHDALTGVYNRGRTEELITAMEESADREEKDASLLMFDIDLFKKVNDTYGHRAGDAVLQGVTRIARNLLDETKGQAIGRWGGEEFFILLPGMNQTEGLAFAEKFRRSIEETAFEGGIHVTVSIGCALIRPHADHKPVYRKIDEALYRAKDQGRNTICLAD